MKIATAVLLVILLLGGVGVSLAETPTPMPSATLTPTLKSIPPSPTSIYLYLKPTPTMLPLNGPPVNLNLVVDSSELADTVINIYRVYNKDGVIDLLMFLGVVAVSLVYVIHWLGKVTKDQ